jgi:hypothetical protein
VAPGEKTNLCSRSYGNSKISGTQSRNFSEYPLFSYCRKGRRQIGWGEEVARSLINEPDHDYKGLKIPLQNQRNQFVQPGPKFPVWVNPVITEGILDLLYETVDQRPLVR